MSCWFVYSSIHIDYADTRACLISFYMVLLVGSDYWFAHMHF